MGIFGTSGLIKANLKTYFKARKKGLDVEETLSWVIQSRYPLSEGNKQNVEKMYLLEIDSLKSEKEKFSKQFSHVVLKISEKEKITKLVLTILFNEYPRLADKCLFSGGQKNIESQIDAIYNSMKKKYSR